MDCKKTKRRIASSNGLLKQPVLTVMMRLTGPMLPAIIAVIGLDLFDTYLAATLGIEALAALSFTIAVTNSLFALAIGLSIGASAVLCYCQGKGDHHKLRRLTTDSILLSSLLAIIVSIAGLLTIGPLFNLLGANYALIPESFHQGPRPDIMPIISDYMQLRYMGFVFLLIPLLSNSIMRATGDTAFAARLMFTWAGLTAIIDALLIFLPHTQPSLVNIGIGHLFADSLFSIISLFCLAKRQKLLDFQLPELSTMKANCRALLTIALPAAGMNLLTPLALGIVTYWIAFYGREAVAAFGVISRIESLALFIPMALSTSLPIFVGQNFAAGNMQRAKTAIKKSVALTIVMQLTVYLLLLLSAMPLARLFSDSVSVITLVVFLLSFLPLSYMGSGIAILAGSSLNAIHRPKASLMLAIIRLFILFVPCAYLGAYLGGLNGLFIGLMIANLSIGFIAYAWLMLTFTSCSADADLTLDLQSKVVKAK
jgi:putative MATE family efflux protein